MVKIKRVASDLRGASRSEEDSYSTYGCKINTERNPPPAFVKGAPMVYEHGNPAPRLKMRCYPPRKRTNQTAEDQVIYPNNRNHYGMREIPGIRVHTLQNTLYGPCNVQEILHESRIQHHHQAPENLSYRKSTGNQKNISRPQDQSVVRPYDESTSSSWDVEGAEEGEEDKSQSALTEDDPYRGNYAQQNDSIVRRRRGSLFEKPAPVPYSTPDANVCLWQPYNTNYRTDPCDDSFSELSNGITRFNPLEDPPYNRKKRSEIFCGCPKPDVVYLCDRSGSICDPRQNTKVYIMDLTTKPGDYRPAPKEPRGGFMGQSSIVGNRCDIATSPPAYSNKYEIYKSYEADDNCQGSVYNDYVQDNPCQTFRCTEADILDTSGKLFGFTVSGIGKAIAYFFLSFLRWLLIFSGFSIALFALLLFINLNAFGYHCALGIIILLFYILIIAPDNLLIYNYFYKKEPL